MRKCLLISFFASFLTFSVFAQQPVRRLPGVINHPSINLLAPFISMDGNAIVFLSDNGREGEYSVSYTSRENDWTPPVELPKHINNRLNFTRGYALSADGKKLFFTSAKSPVIGGYDIFVSELKGNSWTNPENFGMPLNSRTNDGCPSVSSDGKTMYFMRCDKMTAANADGCTIFRIAKKPNGQWDQPEELPANINTGNSQTPRIMADGETLIFSSDKMPANKGGMDLYLTRLSGGTWQDPVPLDFINSERDDQYVSVNALGRYLLAEAKGPRNNWELTEFLIPPHLRPKGLMKIEGTVSGGSGYISVTDVIHNKRVFSGRPGPNGSYFFYLKEGSVYQVAFDPEQSQKTFLVKSFDLTGDKIAQREKLDVVLKAPEPGDELVMDGIEFVTHSAQVSEGSVEYLKRLARLIKANPNLGFDVQVLFQGYREAEEKTDPDLTEQYVIEEPVEQYELIAHDSLIFEETRASADSARASQEPDTIQAPATRERIIYHNDRTKQQAEEIVSQLTSNGVSSDQLTTMVNAIPGGVEGHTTVRIRVMRKGDR